MENVFRRKTHGEPLRHLCHSGQGTFEKNPERGRKPSIPQNGTYPLYFLVHLRKTPRGDGNASADSLTIFYNLYI